jgi:hypothetical protein
MGIALIGTSARAFETKFSGEMRTRGEVFDEHGQDKNNNGDFVRETESEWDSRLRLQLDLVANDNLKGVYQLEIGDVTWGGGSDTAPSGTFGRPFTRNTTVSDSGRLGTDSVNVETRHLYLDFNLPNTPLNAKVGLMPLKLGHGFVFDNDAAALLVSADVDPVTVGAFTFKDYEGNTALDDDTDFYGGFVSANLENMGSVGLFGVYARSRTGDDSTTAAGVPNDEVDIIAQNYGISGNTQHDYDKVDAVWAGLTADLALDSLTIALEADYFYAEFDPASTATAKDFEAQGWLGYLDIGADLDPVRLGVAGLYATGNHNDEIKANDNDGEAFASILPTDPEDACVVDWDNLYLLDITGNDVSNLISGKLYVEMAPVDALKIGVSGQSYWQEEDTRGKGRGQNDYLGTEIDLDLTYDIYDNLAYEVECAYMFTDKDAWGVESGNSNSAPGKTGTATRDIDAEDIWFASHKLVYRF